MKISKFNHMFSTNSDAKLFFNCNTCALGEVEKDALYEIEDILSKVESNEIDKIANMELFEKLKQGRFIIEDDVDEIENYKHYFKLGRRTSKSLSLTIAPTLSCNFKCIYCYEADVLEKGRSCIHENVHNAIVDLIKKQLENGETRDISIGWYGGEPMLEYDYITRASKEFNAIAEKYNVKIRYSMISNGYLFDENKAMELSSLGLMSVQITLDGTRSIHDARRTLKDGSGTFDRLFENVKMISKYLTVVIRVNVDKSNIDEIDNLLKFFAKEGLGSRIAFDFAPMTGISETCSSIRPLCIAEEQFYKLVIRLYDKAVSLGFKVNKYPRVNIISCAAITNRSILIEPDGTLHKCLCSIGLKDQSIGNILDDNSPLEKESKWLTWEPFDYRKCNECNIFPICMGGCPYKAFTTNNGEPVCSEWKHNLKDVLEFTYSCSKAE